LIDEAASRLRIEIDSLPQEIDVVEREIMQLEIERQALQREEDERSKKRLKEIEQRIADLKEKSSGMKAKWQSEKEIIEHIRTAKAELEQLKLQLDQARNAGDLGRASEIQYGTIPELQQKLEVEQTKLGKIQQDGVTKKTLLKSWRNGQACRCRRCSKARCRSCLAWKNVWASASSAKTKRWKQS